MSYQTHQSVTQEIITRFRDYWGKTNYKVKYSNFNLNPTPTSQEVWFELKILYGSSNIGGHICVDGDRRIDRHTGQIVVVIHVPKGTSTTAILNFTALIDKTFSSENWHVEHLHTKETYLSTEQETDIDYIAEVRTPFWFDKNATSSDPFILPDIQSQIQGTPLDG